MKKDTFLGNLKKLVEEDSDLTTQEKFTLENNGILINNQEHPYLWRSFKRPTGARCNRSVCPCIHTEEYYVLTDNHTVYLQYQTTRTPSLANTPVRKTLPGTPFTSPLHIILPWHGPTLCSGYGYGQGYVYVYSMSQSLRALHRCVKSPPIVASGTRH